MNLVLKRVSTSPKGTFGVLMSDFVPICVTLEPPWNNNIEDQSCIPLGTYKCIRFVGKKFGDTFQLVGVPNRTAIEFHEGCYVKDTKGCILLGTNFFWKDAAIYASREARRNFMAWMRDTKEFTLVIS